MHFVKTGKVEVAAIHQVNRSRLESQAFENVDLVRPAIGDNRQNRDVSAQVQQCMKPDGSLVFAKMRPGKKCQTQIDVRSVEGVNCVVQFDSKVFVGIQRPGLCNQKLSEVGEDAPLFNF